MIGLALSTSTDKGSVALFRSTKLLGHKTWSKSRMHGEVLVSLVDQLLRKSKLKPGDLDAIAVDIGPGSFTGVRIGVNVAKSLAYATGAKLFSATSLDILAAGYPSHDKGTLFCAIDAYSGRMYLQRYATGAELKPLDFNIQTPRYSELGALEQDSRTCFIGQMSDAVRSQLASAGAAFSKKAASNFPQAKTLWQMMMSSHSRLEEVRWQELEPLYVRAPDVVEKLANQSMSIARPPR